MIRPSFLSSPRRVGGISWQVDTKEASGHGDGSWSQKVPNTSAAGAGRKPFRSRSGGNVGNEKEEEELSGEQGPPYVAAKFFHGFTASLCRLVGLFFDDEREPGTAQLLSRCHKKQKSMKRGWQGELACSRRLVRKRQHRSLCGNWGTE